MKKKPPAFRRDTTAVVDTMIVEAIAAYYADRRAGVMPFYLMFKQSTPYLDGVLQFVADGQTDNAKTEGWELVLPEGFRGSLERHQLFNKIRPVAGRLPILASNY
jgi:hypothetical protein